MNRRLAWALGILAGWTVLAVLFIPQNWILNRRAPQPPTVLQLLGGNLALFWGWAVLTPIVVRFGRRFPIALPHRTKHLLYYFGAAFVFAFVHLFVAGAGHWLLAAIAFGYRRPPDLTSLAVSYGATNVMICWGLLAGSQALAYFRQSQERETQLAHAQLHSLKTQLHPHFLFNTLNAIAELLHQDPARAEQTITELSDLLRSAITRSEAREVALGDELAFLRSYLDIQQTLLQERLSVRWRVEDGILDAHVPPMLLQPVVENAIQHGVGGRTSGGTIEITAGRTGNALLLVVEDDGVGVKAGARDGVGLANTRARLQAMYGDDQSLTLSARAGGGTRAEIRLPAGVQGPDVA